MNSNNTEEHGTDRTEALPTDATAAREQEESSMSQPQSQHSPEPERDTAATAADSQGATGMTAERTAYDTDEEPAPSLPRPTGPHAPAITLGVICLAIAGLVLAQELGALSVDWGNVGPLGIVAAGLVLVVLGIVGLLSSRRSSD